MSLSIEPSSRAGGWRGAVAELREREPRLAAYGAVLLALLLPMALAWALDERTLRGANVWIKPMKFSLSIALLAFTTAWFIGHLPPARRATRAVSAIVWVLVGAGSFELAYIGLQAGLGQGSHYNVSDPVHAVMYPLMGIGALALTATQPALAWQLLRHPSADVPAALRRAVLIGLVLTFVLGAGIGGLLSALQPPDAGTGLPFFGWSLRGGDLRPAHFVGIHAEQALPLVAFAAVRSGVRRPTAVVLLATLAWLALFAALVAWGLPG